MMRLPISRITSMAVSCHAPAVSMANGQKMWVLAKLLLLVVVVVLLTALHLAPAYSRVNHAF